ncbi:potassium transporter TrkA [Halorubrum sp. CBA1125]|nr:potassium transporter TrkA [Halorubrum sp. CBA1125]
MPITESDLPGVGKKFEIDLGDGEMVVVIHNTGKREVFRRSDPDADSEKVFEFGDDLARTIGSIIEGAHFQPIEPDTQETTLPGGILLEWYELQPGSPLIGETLESADIGNRTGLAVVAIQREDAVIDSPGADTILREGDTVIGVAPARTARRSRSCSPNERPTRRGERRRTRRHVGRCRRGDRPWLRPSSKPGSCSPPSRSPAGSRTGSASR